MPPGGQGCWSHPWTINCTGPGTVLLVPPAWVFSSSLPTPRFFSHLSFPPLCLPQFMKGSETPNFHKQKSLALFLTSSFVTSSSSWSKGRRNLSHKRVLNQVIFPKQERCALIAARPFSSVQKRTMSSSFSPLQLVSTLLPRGLDHKLLRHRFIVLFEFSEIIHNSLLTS